MLLTKKKYLETNVQIKAQCYLLLCFIEREDTRKERLELLFSSLLV